MAPRPHGIRTWALLVLALSLGTSVLSSVALGLPGDPGLLDADEAEYWKLSGRFLDGSYEFQSRRVLGYPILLAGLRWLGAGVATAHLALSMLFGLTAPLVTLAMARLGIDRRAAILGGALIAVWPPLLYYGSSLYSEVAALPLFALFLLVLARPGPQGAWSGAWKPSDVAAGLLLGCCVHVRPMYILFTPLVPIVLLTEERSPRRALVRTVVIGVFTAAAIAPWTVHVSSHYGRFVPLSTNGGETIAGGLTPELIESGTTTHVTPDGRVIWSGPGKWLPMRRNGYLSPEELRLDPLSKDALLKRRVFAWIGENPGTASYLELRKLAYMWGVYPLWNGAAQTFVGQVPTWFLLAAVALLAAREGGRCRELARFWALPVFVSLVSLISWGSWRFRQPGDVGLLAVVATLAVAAWSSRREAESRADRDRSKGEAGTGAAA